MKISSKFKSIQSSIFCAVSILVLSAVLVVTVVSLRYTNSSIYENSVMYTQTIIKQLNQNIDSYISYMDNIASVIAQSGDAYKYLYMRRCQIIPVIFSDCICIPWLCIKIYICISHR